MDGLIKCLTDWQVLGQKHQTLMIFCLKGGIVAFGHCSFKRLLSLTKYALWCSFISRRMSFKVDSAGQHWVRKFDTYDNFNFLRAISCSTTLYYILCALWYNNILKKNMWMKYSLKEIKSTFITSWLISVIIRKNSVKSIISCSCGKNQRQLRNFLNTSKTLFYLIRKYIF